VNRRDFAQAMAASGLAAVASGRAPIAEAVPAGFDTLSPWPEFGLSVMLWTVFRGLPFEERLAKVAEAGYRVGGRIREVERCGF